jgi:hypothetical protein
VLHYHGQGFLHDDSQRDDIAHLELAETPFGVLAAATSCQQLSCLLHISYRTYDGQLTADHKTVICDWAPLGHDKEPREPGMKNVPSTEAQLRQRQRRQ